MKFTLEKLDIKFISRKVVEEEQRTGRFVHEVLLTPPEWVEFLSNLDHMRYMAPTPYQDGEMLVHIHRPMKAYNTSLFEVYSLVTNPITVKLEPYKAPK